MKKLITITLTLGILSSFLVSCASNKPCAAYGKVNSHSNLNKSI